MTADPLPVSLPPRGLSRVHAAAYIGVSPSLFDGMVADGRMPPAKRINVRNIWDRLQLDEAFTVLRDPGRRRLLLHLRFYTARQFVAILAAQLPSSGYKTNRIR